MEWLPIPVFLPGESDGQMSLEHYSPYSHKEMDTTEWLNFHKDLVKSQITCIKSLSI